MRRPSATILVTHLGAAERQLNAAIRMTFASEDDLAIHVVAAAAYRVLRDIKQKTRDRGDAFDLFHRGLYQIANELATGKRNAIPADFTGPIVDVIESYRAAIVGGDITSFEDIPSSTIDNEGRFWYEFNTPFNFLKHAAQDDHQEAFDLTTINNDELLLRVCAVFCEITNRMTPEIEVYFIYMYSDRDDSGIPDELRSELAKLTPTQKRKKCRTWLRSLKSNPPVATRLPQGTS